MKRKEDPVRYCELKSCGALLVRKEHPSGTEDYCHFIKRRFCDRKCGVAGRTLIATPTRKAPLEMVELDRAGAERVAKAALLMVERACRASTPPRSRACRRTSSPG